MSFALAALPSFIRIYQEREKATENYTFFHIFKILTTTQGNTPLLFNRKVFCASLMLTSGLSDNRFFDTKVNYVLVGVCARQYQNIIYIYANIYRLP